MKTKYFLPISLLVLFSCGDSSSTNENTETTKVETSVPEGYEELDLTPYGIMATIKVPGQTSADVQVQATDWGSVLIDGGDAFGMEIIPGAMSVSMKKEEIQGDAVYQVNIIAEDENSILFERQIPDSGIDAEYHFFCTQTVNGESLEIKSLAENGYSKSAAENMLKAAKSISPKAAS